MRRADIHAVGIVVDAAEGGRPMLTGWHFQGGDIGHYIPTAGRVERFGGWSVDELRVIFVLWSAYRFPLPILGKEFSPVPESAEQTHL